MRAKINKPITTSRYCQPCKKTRCTTCQHNRTMPAVKCTSNVRYVKAVAHSNCQTHDFVYVIVCKRCKKQYVCQTYNALHICLQQHLRDIKQANQYKAVSHHFTSTNDNPLDLTVNSVDTASRLNTHLPLKEAWIITLGTQEPAGLNQRS